VPFHLEWRAGWQLFRMADPNHLRCYTWKICENWQKFVWLCSIRLKHFFGFSSIKIWFGSALTFVAQLLQLQLRLPGLTRTAVPCVPLQYTIYNHSIPQWIIYRHSNADRITASYIQYIVGSGQMGAFY